MRFRKLNIALLMSHITTTMVTFYNFSVICPGRPEPLTCWATTWELGAVEAGEGGALAMQVRCRLAAHLGRRNGVGVQGGRQGRGAPWRCR